MDWAEKYRGLLAVAHPRWSPGRITSFLKNHTHLMELTPTEDRALEVLHRNVPLHGNSDKEHPLIMWYVAFISKPDLKAVLELAPEALDIRIYVIKRILGCDLVDKQKLLLLPFERVCHPDAAPLDADKPLDREERLAFHHLMDELRFRKHEIESYGKRPERRPYVNMMAAETRPKFLHRLITFVKGKDGGFKPPPFKREVLRRKSEFG